LKYIAPGEKKEKKGLKRRYAFSTYFMGETTGERNKIF
jgi:hypothetical protein